ncbi:MAG: asparagine--tRNA ligase, partial [Bacilli bacterium]|nr:asparagine--tRNA ligase [Bacilli bacterium]
MELKKIHEEYEQLLDTTLELQGWVRNHRRQKEYGFIDLSDGTCFKTIQIVYTNELQEFDDIQKIRVGSSINIKGMLVKSEGGGQKYEIKASDIILLGDCPEDYPIQPKRHSMEFLREQAYLRPRTNLFNAVFRVRSKAAYAIHTYFQEHGYVYTHTPLITTTDCEGSDQMFKITTLDFDNLPK